MQARSRRAAQARPGLLNVHARPFGESLGSKLGAADVVRYDYWDGRVLLKRIRRGCPHIPSQLSLINFRVLIAYKVELKKADALVGF